jgi:hypothetical protein
MNNNNNNNNNNIIIIIIIIIIIRVQLIISSTGIVTKEIKEYLETLSGRRSIDSIQRTSVLGT